MTAPEIRLSDLDVEAAKARDGAAVPAAQRPERDHVNWDTGGDGRPTREAVGEIVRSYGDHAVAFMVEKFGLPPKWCEAAVRAVLHPNGKRQPPVADDDFDEMVLAAIPGYPLSKLVGPLREFVTWAVKDGLLAPAVGAAGLSALATVSGYAELEFRSTVTIRPALWFIPIGGPGTGKSPARYQAFRPIERLYAEERRLWKLECQAVRDRNAQLAAKPKVPAPAEPLPPRPEPLTLSDANMPVVARWLEAGGGAGTLAYDEVKALISGLTMAERAKMMEAWTARDALHLQRVGQGGGVNEVDIYVERPVLGIFGPLTLKDLQLLGQEGDGFRSRWLPHIVKGKARMLDAGPPPPSWAATLERLYNQREIRTWHLSAGAADEYELATKRWETEQEQPYPPGVIEALRKAETQCLRISLPLAESVYQGGKRVISAEVMIAAIALTDYALDCWKALPGGSVLTLGFQDEKLVAATDELLAWLEDRPLGNEGLPPDSPARPRATRREIQMARVGGARDAESVTAMILKYGRQYPGCVVRVEQTGGKGGGRPRLFVYFPRREQLSGGQIDVATTPIGATFALPPDPETAGQSAAEAEIIGVAGVNTDTGNTDTGNTDNKLEDAYGGWPAGSIGAEANRRATPANMPRRRPPNGRQP